MEEETAKALLKKYLQALCDDLENANHLAKTHNRAMEESNKALSAQLEEFYSRASKTLIPIVPTDILTQKIAQSSLESCGQDLNAKLQQIREYTAVMEKRIKEDCLRLREAFNAIFYLEDVSTMPYYDVEASTQALQQKIEEMTLQIEGEKQTSLQIINDLQSQHADIQKDIANLELVKNELSLSISKCQDKIRDNLIALEMDPSAGWEEIHAKVNEMKMLISELEAKLVNNGSTI